MDDNKRTGIEELRRRQAARQDSGQGASGSGRGGPPRGPGWKLAVLSVLAVLVVGAVGLGTYRAGIAGRTDPQPLEAPAVQVTQDPITPEDPPEQTSEPQGTDGQPEEPPEPSEPAEPEVDHTGQYWAELCDGTVVYENDGQSIDGLDNVYICPSGKDNIVSEIALEFPVHLCDRATGENIRSVRYGDDVTFGEFLKGIGYSSWDDLIADLKRREFLYDHGYQPNIWLKDGLPDTFDYSKPAQAYINKFYIEQRCIRCLHSPEGEDYYDSFPDGILGLRVNGVSAYDLDSVVAVLGMPVYGLAPRCVDPAYFDASEGYFEAYVWDMGSSGFLGINFKEQRSIVVSTFGEFVSRDSIWVNDLIRS